MKNLKYISILLLILFSSSCGEDFLDLTPLSSYTTENFYETEEQIEQAVNGLYGIYGGLSTGSLWQTGEFRSDNSTFQYNPSDRGATEFEQIDYFLAESNNGLFSGIWNSCYTFISRCHFILESIDEIEFSSEEKKQILLGEVRFTRAYCYYLLTSHFGDVPMIDRVILTEEEAAAIRRSPVTEVYSNFIIPDIEFAIANLPDLWDNKNSGRASADAARMVMANAYFSIKDYNAALPFLAAVVESNRYKLLPNFRNVFDPASGYHEEIIFGSPFNSELGIGAGFFIRWLPLNSGTELTDGVFVGTPNAGKHIPTQDIIDAFEPSDRRLAASIGIYDPSGAAVPYIKKYLFTPVGNTGSSLVFPIYRLADAQLMYAEALLEVQGGLPNEVFEILNALRSRAGLPFYFPGNPNPDLNLDSTEKLISAVRNERRLELAFENKRFFDLVRWGTLQETMRAHGEEMKVLQSEFLGSQPNAYTNIPELYPIPFNQIELYNYTQNNGW